MIMRDNSGPDENHDRRFHDDDLKLDPEAASRFIDAVFELDDAEAAWPNGSRLGEYILIEKLGEGGSGLAYLAHRRGSQQLVTIKIFKSIGDSRNVWRELEALTHVQCPAVPRLYETGEQAGRLYIAYEFVDGVSLLEHATHSCATLHDKVHLLAQVARSMQRMHELGLIHRDVKPGNIIVTNDARILFVDFGTAAVLRTRQLNKWTIDGELLGTPGYMSPEQARGEQSSLSTRSDMYSLGAVGYQLLTGELPHPQNAAYPELIRRVTQDAPRDPRTINPQLPRPLAAVLHKAVAQNPARRFATALEFASELERWLDGRPVETVPTPWYSRAWMAARRNPRLASATSFAAAAVVGCAVLAGVAIAQAQVAEQGRQLGAKTVTSFVEQLKQGNYDGAFQVLKMIEIQASNPLTEDAAGRVANSRQDMAVKLLAEIYGPDLLQHPAAARELDQMFAELNALSQSQFQGRKDNAD